jgi:hypothetical protein
MNRTYVALPEEKKRAIDRTCKVALDTPSYKRTREQNLSVIYAYVYADSSTDEDLFYNFRYVYDLLADNRERFLSDELIKAVADYCDDSLYDYYENIKEKINALKKLNFYN